jgi:hypothetical protein
LTNPERQRGGTADPPLAIRAPSVYAARACWIIFFAVAFVHLLRFPTEIDGPGLDASWQQCLGYFLQCRFQAGVDYVWTYGPLGYFATQSYNADLFWWKYAWEIAINLVLAAALTAIGVCLRPFILQAAYVVVILVVPPRWDAVYLAALLWPVVLLLRQEQPGRGILSALGCWLALLGLVKFTWLLLASCAWLVVVVGFGRSPGRRVEALFGFPMALAAIWLALGQAPGHFGRYLASSCEIGAGYSEAMATAGDFGPALLAVLLLLALVLALALRIRSAGWLLRPLAGSILIVTCALFAWKHGFTRQPSHQVLFFSFMALVPFAAAAAVARLNAPPTLFEIASTLLIAAAAVGALVDSGNIPGPAAWWDARMADARDLVAPLQMRQRCQERYDALAAEWALPRLSAIVGTDSVDQLSCDQGVVLLNRWNYHPRPVFQSYSAYTPRLLADNAAFFAGDRAPRFILWRLAPLDGRLPTSEDGSALLEILRRYRPVAEEHGFLLLEHRVVGPVDDGRHQVVWDGDVGFGEDVNVPDPRGLVQVVHMRIGDTIRGKLTRLFYRPPVLWLHVRTADRTEGRFRLIPALASAGFLINPFLQNDADVKHWYEGTPPPGVASIAVEASPAARACYGDRIRVVIERQELDGGRP